MRFKKVLLINLPVKGAYLGTYRVLAGLGYLSECLSFQGIDNIVIDVGLGYSLRQVEKKIREWGPDLIGISMLTFGYKHNYLKINELKKNFPNIPIVVGGPHVSLLREKTLAECEGIDFGVVLEGEYILLELCEGKKVAKIAGLIYRDDAEIIYNGDRPFIEELDKIPFPRYEKFELHKYIREIPIITSRGCPFQCTYCAVRNVIGNRFRARSASNVVDEMEYWYHRGYRQFNFLDDNFTLIKRRVYEICDGIKKRGLKNLFLQCSNGVRADRVDRELLERMKDIGFRSLAFGVESGNDRILKRMKKAESVQTIEKAIKNACELEYDVALFFVVGTPGETIQEVWDSIRIAQKYPVMKVNFYNLVPYPRTELFDQIQEKGGFLQQPEEYLNNASPYSDKPIFKTQEFSLKDKEKIFIILRRIERTVMRKWIYGKLRPYVSYVAYPLSYIFVTPLVQKLLFNNRLFRKALEDSRFWIYTRLSR